MSPLLRRIAKTRFLKVATGQHGSRQSGYLRWSRKDGDTFANRRTVAPVCLSEECVVLQSGATTTDVNNGEINQYQMVQPAASSSPVSSRRSC